MGAAVRAPHRPDGQPPQGGGWPRSSVASSDDPRVETITITGVQVTDDLRAARVQVSTLGPREEREAVLAVLSRAAPYLRQRLAGRIEMRRMPELDFALRHGARGGAAHPGAAGGDRRG